MNVTRGLTQRILKILASRAFLIVVLVLFSLQAIWVSFMAIYPLPFDEIIHFKLIDYYSNHLSPFINNQPPELSALGDATRYTSYLYHYLLSFPMRLIELITNDQASQIIILRLINISIVIGALIVLRRVLLEAKFSKPIVHSALLLYCLLPVTSFLAAHINYDNLLMLFFAIFSLFGLRVLTALKMKRVIKSTDLIMFLLIGLFACLVKFTFIPVFVGGAAYIIFLLIGSKKIPKLPTFSNRRSLIMAIIIFILFAISLSLITERYGGNLVKYGSVAPDCAKVQSVNTCQNNGPWARNYALRQAASEDSNFTPGTLPGYVLKVWSPIMIEGFGLVGSSLEGVKPPPLIVNYAITGLMIFIIAGLGVALISHRNDRFIMFIIVGTVAYLLTLVYRNYSEFAQFHEAVAVQGRYILFLLVPLLAVALKSLLMVNKKVRQVSITILGGIGICFVVMNPHVVYVRQSEVSWYRNDATVKSVYNFEKSVFGTTQDWER